MLAGLQLDSVFFESFLCTGVISAFLKFDGNTDDAIAEVKENEICKYVTGVFDNFSSNIRILTSLHD